MSVKVEMIYIENSSSTDIFQENFNFITYQITTSQKEVYFSEYYMFGLMDSLDERRHRVRLTKSKVFKFLTWSSFFEGPFMPSKKDVSIKVLDIIDYDNSNIGF